MEMLSSECFEFNVQVAYRLKLTPVSGRGVGRPRMVARFRASGPRQKGRDAQLPVVICAFPCHCIFCIFVCGICLGVCLVILLLETFW